MLEGCKVACDKVGNWIKLITRNLTGKNATDSYLEKSQRTLPPTYDSGLSSYTTRVTDSYKVRRGIEDKVFFYIKYVTFSLIVKV